MKSIVILLCVTAVCAGLFFFAPHHRPTGDPFKPTTLSQLYRQFFASAPEVTRPSVAGFILLALVGLATAFYPAVFVAFAHWALPAPGQPAGALYVLGGLLAVAGALANFIAILVSHMTIGFGTSDATRDLTAFCWIIPLFQLVFGVASFAVGCSASLTGWLGRVLGVY